MSFKYQEGDFSDSHKNERPLNENELFRRQKRPAWAKLSKWYNYCYWNHLAFPFKINATRINTCANYLTAVFSADVSSALSTGRRIVEKLTHTHPTYGGISKGMVLPQKENYYNWANLILLLLILTPITAQSNMTSSPSRTKAAQCLKWLYIADPLNFMTDKWRASLALFWSRIKLL